MREMEKNIEIKEGLSFEEGLKRLTEAAEAMQRSDVALEEALVSYEKGIAYYNYCSELLEKARQKIEVYDKANNLIKEL